MLAPLFSERVALAEAGTRSSTSGMTFPEDSGVLPRASMPEGSAEQRPPVNPADREADKTRKEESATIVGPRDATDWRSRLSMSWEGYLKVIAEGIESDPKSPFVGRNNGFRVGNARLGFTAMYEKNLHAFISLEATAENAEDLNSPNSTFAPGPRDMYLGYDFARAATVRLGRFKTPYDIGELQEESGRIFIDTPVESRGIGPTQGYQLEGMRQDRQIGLMIKSERVGLSDGGFDIGYAVALTNGRTLNFSLNDNNSLAAFARLSLLYGSWVTFNLAAFVDTRTKGAQPNLFDEDWKGGEASLILRLMDLRLEGQLLIQKADFSTTGAPTVTAKGFHAQASYRYAGFEPAYRFAYYDPNDLDGIFKVNEHTLGLSYYFAALPLRFTVNVTLAGEEPARRLKNNRLAAMAQFNF